MKKMLKYLKTLLLMAIGVSAIVFCAIMFRKICYLSVTAVEENYLLITTNTPLYKFSPSTENNIEQILLPKSYYAELISEHDDYYYVYYNSLFGYTNKTDLKKVSELSGNLFQRTDLTTQVDSGTYLRVSPSTKSTSLKIIPPATPLNFLGSISGEKPSDGSSSTWYYVEYPESETQITRGYVYSERVNLKTPLTEQQSSRTDSSENMPPETILDPASTTSPEADLAPVTLSKGLKIFLIILFSVLALIIFLLIMFAPKFVEATESDELKGTRLVKEKSGSKSQPLSAKTNFTQSINLGKNQNHTQKYSQNPRGEQNSVQIYSKNTKNEQNPVQQNTKTRPNSSKFLPDIPSLPAYQQSEFASYINFSQPVKRFSSFSQEGDKRVHSEKNNSKKIVRSSPLPSGISKFFD